MPSEICIKCLRPTPSVIQTVDGHTCYTCYSLSQNPQKAKRVISHDEADIQADFFSKVKLFFPSLPDKLLFAVPNGGSRNKIEAASLKRQGVKAGVSDVILLIRRNGYASLCLEFKTKIGTQSEEQKEFQRQAEHTGSKYLIVRSVSEAIEAMKAYLL